ncbi:MAG: HD domain-containing protein [Fibromonadaceae bacterium]|jgi:HD-GYP domain-containing protein (c-di-GMP phosphodiesterase class II)|nr:HD domain-containing protein [Fibromonadaceae bacterium]
MIQIAINELRAGQALARSIYRDTGEIMLSTGFRMTSDLHEKLIKMGIDRIWVQEEGLESLESEDTVPEMVVNQSVLLLRKTVLEFRSKIGLTKINPMETPPSPEEILSKPELIKDSLKMPTFKKAAADIFQELRRADPSILHLSGTRSIGNFYQQHSVECSIVAAFLAKRYNYSPDEIEDLILAVLLMDIGYALLPEHLLHPNSKLSLGELELKKRHPDYGFDILRICNMSLICANVALQHHERQDGGGYPRKLFGNNKRPIKTTGPAQKGTINRYAEIAAVAHDYISLIAPAPGVAAQTPIGSMKFLIRLSGSKLNSSVVETLLSMIPVYSSGQRIVVTTDPTGEYTGFVGVVMKSNTREQNRPSIALIFNRDGEKVPAIMLNLKERTDIEIKESKLGEIKAAEPESEPSESFD